MLKVRIHRSLAGWTLNERWANRVFDVGARSTGRTPDCESGNQGSNPGIHPPTATFLEGREASKATRAGSTPDVVAIFVGGASTFVRGRGIGAVPRTASPKIPVRVRSSAPSNKNMAQYLNNIIHKLLTGIPPESTIDLLRALPDDGFDHLRRYRQIYPKPDGRYVVRRQVEDSSVS